MSFARSVHAGLVFPAALLISFGAAAQDPSYLADVEAGERALRRGEISKARQLFDDVVLDHEELAGEPDAPADDVALRARVGLLRILLRGGEYAVVREKIAALSPADAASRPVRLILAEAASRSGEDEAALAALRAVIAAAADDVVAGSRLGLLLIENGQRDEGRQQLERVVELSRTEPLREADDLTAVARALIALGGRDRIERAAVLLIDAIRVDPDHAGARCLRGELQFHVYGEWSGAESGEKMLLEVLERNGEIEAALVALYRIRRANHLLDPSKTELFLERALSLNPNSVPALVERGIALVDDRRFEEGERIFERALAVDPRDKPALAQAAAVALLAGDEERAQELRARAMAVDPDYGGVDLAIGDRMVALYRFRDALPFYEAALARDGQQIDAMHGLAKALVYSGDGERAREVLQQAKDAQPGFVNPWRNNVIAVQDLLEEEYERVEEGGFTFVLHRDDRAVLERYLVPFQLEARRELGAKYGYEPTETVRIEAFHTWDDFSVRTIGFRGFTALGACFGPLITLVSPVDSDLRRNDFMWTATAWHEYTHVLTLALSRHRVPRWLTEGFSVYEEGQKNRAWERGMDRDLLDAFHNREIAPVRLLNRLFRGPRILFGYYQGGLIVGRLADQYGFDKVVDMLRAYGRDLSTEEVFEQTFGISTETFDANFLRWVEETKLAKLRLVPRWNERAIQRMSSQLSREPDDLDTRLDLAWAMLQRGSEVDAGDALRPILAKDRDHPEAQLVYAELLRRRGRLDEAAAAFDKGFGGGADDFDSRMAYGKLLVERGDVEAAIVQFEAAKACWPGCTDQHVAPELALARLYGEAGRRGDSMAELGAFCARTARAYEPRIQLAAFARQSGDRRREAELLEESIAIDPFVRQVHLDLADALLATDRRNAAVRELEVALAVVPALDRAYLDSAPAEVPRVDGPEFKQQQAEICLRIAQVLRTMSRGEAARDWLERALRESPDSDAAAEARALLGDGETLR